MRRRARKPGRLPLRRRIWIRCRGRGMVGRAPKEGRSPLRPRDRTSPRCPDRALLVVESGFVASGSDFLHLGLRCVSDDAAGSASVSASVSGNSASCGRFRGGKGYGVEVAKLRSREVQGQHLVDGQHFDRESVEMERRGFRAIPMPRGQESAGSRAQSGIEYHEPQALTSCPHTP